MKYSLIAVIIAGGLLSSCTVGPNYVRPTVPVPQNFRAPGPLPAPQAASLADLDVIVAKEMETWKVPGLAVAIATTSPTLATARLLRTTSTWGIAAIPATGAKSFTAS